MGNFLVVSTFIVYVGVLMSPLLNAQELTTLNEKTCTAYDETLVNGMCEISMDKIPFCPGVVSGSVCITEAKSINQ